MEESIGVGVWQVDGHLHWQCSMNSVVSTDCGQMSVAAERIVVWEQLRSEI